MSLKIASFAPDFTLPASTGDVFTLFERKHPWAVVYFYPKDNTPGCTQEACDFRSLMPDFSALECTIVGISPDDLLSHQGFIEKYALTFPLLSDPSLETFKAYGAFGTKVRFGKVSEGILRTTVLIDPDHRIAAIWKNVRVDRHAEKILEHLRKLQKTI